MSENSFFIPGLPKDSQPPASASSPRPHSEQGNRAATPPAPHNEQGNLAQAREPDRYQPADSADKSAPPHPLRVHPLTTLCVAALLAALLVQALVSQSTGSIPIAFAVFGSTVVFGFLFSLVPFAILGKSNRALNLAMCVQMCLGIAGAGYMTYLHTLRVEDQKVIASAEASLSGLNGEMRRQLSAGDAASISPADIDHTAQAMNKAADKLQGDDAAVLRASATLMADLAERNRAFDELSDQLEALGGLDPSTMASRDDILQRIALIDQFLTLNRRFEAELKLTPRRFRESLVKQGLNQRQLARAENEFAAGFKLPMQVQFRQLQARFGSAARAYLGILADQWGRWTYSNATGQVVFEDSDAIAQFNQASETLQGSMLAMATIQREVLNVNLAQSPSDE
ncbi:MAG: hypothetical protein AB7G11_17825 [Phycisphaerales bacterium]